MFLNYNSESGKMMENVPVKIAERYKPPPQIRQHSVQLNSNKFQSNYYNEAPEFNYDFQLERKVLATLPTWRKMRQMNKESRLERQEKRRLQRLRENEEKEKKLLDEVKYPSAEELSSSTLYESNQDNNEEYEEVTGNEVNGFELKEQKQEQQQEMEIVSDYKEELNQQINNFNNILQPTILNRSLSEPEKEKNLYSAITKIHQQPQQQEKPMENIVVNLIRNSSFNYKDFEDDTSSPFDNIELKTINDLDILAQVLHNTQKLNLDHRKDINKSNDEETVSSSESPRSPLETQNIDYDLETNTEANLGELEVELKVVQKPLEVISPKNQLESVNFNHLEHLLENANDNDNDNENIPETKEESNACHFNNTKLASNLSIPFINNPSNNCFACNSNMVYNLQANHNYVITPNSNGYTACESFSSPVHTLYPSQCHQDYNYHITTLADHRSNIFTSPSYKLPPPQRLEIYDSKSKSVPDILKELRQEVTNSANRRIRNYSQNLDSKNNLLEEENEHEQEQSEEKQTRNESKKHEILSHPHPKEFQGPPNLIIRNICAMGFPRDRVTRVSEIVGEDDKKILEHLITLTDLLDLGFDEEKISDALLKYDNNKEKALEHLIS